MITQERLKYLFSYSKYAGIFTRLVTTSSRAVKGVVAGSSDFYGYLNIKIDGRTYKCHRLAWLYVKGIWPAEDVEHKNLKRGDNRWINLRLAASDSLNQANVGRRADNTSGYKSVHKRKGCSKFRARIQVNKRRISLGDFDTPKAAHAAYMVAAKKHFGEFARG